MSQALQVQPQSGSFAGLVTLYNLFGQRGCCFQIQNLALAALAMVRSVGRAPRAAVLLSAPPPAAAAAALDAVVYSQSPLDFGLVAAADT
jgi:hypothetical protein